MASIETLEDRAAPSDSIGTLLGLGLAGGLFPQGHLAGRPFQAVSGDALGPADGNLDSALAGRGDDEDGTDSRASRFREGSDRLQALTTNQTVATNRIVATNDAPLPVPPADVLPDPLPAALSAITSDAALDRVFFSPHGTGGSSASVGAAQSPLAGNPPVAPRASALDRPSAGSSATGAAPEASLSPAGAQLLAGTASMEGGGTPLQFAALSLQPAKGGGVQSFSSNSPPVAVDDSTGAPGDMPIDIPVVDNDSDPNGDPFSVYSFDATSTQGGTILWGAEGSLNYTAPSGFTGVDTFTYDLIDEPLDFSPGLISNRATVTVDVTEVPGEPGAPPVANNDIAWTAAGQSIGIFVRSNDLSEDWDSLQIIDVTQPGQGSVTFGPEDLSYFPDPEFTTGGDTFDYTVEDAWGQTATATVTVTMVEVTDYTLEWLQPDDSWIVIPAGGHVWSHDILRWTAHYSPSAPPVASTIDWLKKDWADVDNPLVPWETFASAPCDCLAFGNPGMGDWAITPGVNFSSLAAQTEFVAIMLQPPNLPDIEIASVSWAGVRQSDGATNLFDDNPPEMGGGWWIFPDQNTETGPNHKEVEIVISITPAKLGIPIKLKLFDPDDPTAAEGPIDADPNTTDNRGGTPIFPTGASTSELLVGGAIARRRFMVMNNPGDNYRVLAARQTADFSGIKVISSDTNPEVAGRLYRDENGNGVFDGEDPYIDETRPLWIDNGPAVFSTPLLTVWRRLNVEVDSMGAPPQGEQFDPDDLLGGDVADPATSALVDAFHPAFIVVQVLPGPANGPSDPAIPFGQAFQGFNAMDCFFVSEHCAAAGLPQLPGQRGTSDDEPMYWTAYVAGIYEWRREAVEPLSPDNDHPVLGDDEYAFLGVTRTEAHTAGADYSTIPMEVIRDVAAENGWTAEQTAHVQAAMTVHEIGHQFDLAHSGEFTDSDTISVMTVHATEAEEALFPNIGLQFNDADINDIRKFGSSKPNP